MWKELWKKWAEDPHLPHIALGDWNSVEDPMDRNYGAAETVLDSFKRLKDLLRLQDGTGDGTSNIVQLETRKFMRRVQELAAQLLKDLEDLQGSDRDSKNNIQTLWAKFKFDVTAYGKYCSRFITNETTREIRAWKAQLKIVVHDRNMTQEDRSMAAYLLEKKIADRLSEESEKKKALSEARYDVEGETLRTTLWTRSAKGYHPKESILDLRVENEANSALPLRDSSKEDGSDGQRLPQLDSREGSSRRVRKNDGNCYHPRTMQCSSVRERVQ
ncbi:hypothetical protein C8R44DRAFT_726157 [Mycena epipterygia]|nr:hypothetical protein C8R44DRAFT_726157 [Mycena epipterygia]